MKERRGFRLGFRGGDGGGDLERAFSSDDRQRYSVGPGRSLNFRIPSAGNRRPAVRAGAVDQTVRENLEPPTLDDRCGALRTACVLPFSDATGQVPGVNETKALFW